MSVRLTQPIESHMPRSSHIGGSMVLPDAAVVCSECDVQRPEMSHRCYGGTQGWSWPEGGVAWRNRR
jgi:hypothetical protein